MNDFLKLLSSLCVQVLRVQSTSPAPFSTASHCWNTNVDALWSSWLVIVTWLRYQEGLLPELSCHILILLICPNLLQKTTQTHQYFHEKMEGMTDCEAELVCLFVGYHIRQYKHVLSFQNSSKFQSICRLGIGKNFD